MRTIEEKIRKIKYLFTDVDGVLTDAGVYYSSEGEIMKKFSLRDGMGVERLLKIANIPVGIITGEQSEIVQRRAEKLKISEVHIGVKDKLSLLKNRLITLNLELDEIAFIGDDFNDLELIKNIGLSAAPNDAMQEVINNVDYHCKQKGGEGAFREFCELIIKKI